VNFNFKFQDFQDFSTICRHCASVINISLRQAPRCHHHCQQ